MNYSDFIQALPKAELHLHLEGTVTPDSWLELLVKNNLLDDGVNLDQLKQEFKFGSFMEFLALYGRVLGAFKSPDNFYLIAKKMLKNLAAQNVRYAEVMFTPWFFTKKGIDFHEIMAEIKRALLEVQQENQIEMKMIFDGPRNFGKQVVREVFELAISDKSGLVVGVGLGGDEKNFPAPMFIDEFEFAQANGLKTIAHAGETAGEQSMLDTIETLKVSRLGHCLGIPADSRLEKLIKSKNITLDLCPWSNVATAVIEKIEDHPLADYLARELPICLNSDDPGFFHTSIIKEYNTMAELHQLTYQNLADLSINSVKGSFMTLSEKNRILNEIYQLLENWHND